MAQRQLPIVLLDCNGQLMPFYADLETRKYTMVHNEHWIVWEEEVDGTMNHVIEYASVRIH